MAGQFPYLSLLLALPLAGVAAVWLAPRGEAARAIAAAAVAATLALAIAAIGALDHDFADFQLVEKAVWIPSLNVHYHVGVDGISALFLPLACLLFLGVVLASWSTVQHLQRLYYSLLLAQLAVTLGVFCALDTLLFFLFWELSLVPLFFLLSLWGVGPHRRFAASQYTMVMLASGVPLLFAFLLLGFNHAEFAGAAVPQGLAFDLPTLLATPASRDLQLAVFLLLVLGFAAKTPMVPLHAWLPVAAMEGPVAVTALIVGLKLGAYGLIRFAVPLAPAAAHELHWLLAGLGTAGILYGAVAACVQNNLRRMLAYAAISHVGLVVLGISSFTLQGLQGAVLQTLNFSLVAGGAFLLAGFLHQRTGSTDTLSLGGVAQTMPRLAGFYLLATLAAIGVPLTAGFPAEFLILVSALGTHTGAGIAALFGAVIGAGYMLGMYRRAFLGPATTAAVLQAEDLRPRELALCLGFALLTVAIGVYPMLFLDLIRPAAQAWLARG